MARDDNSATICLGRRDLPQGYGPMRSHVTKIRNETQQREIVSVQFALSNTMSKDSADKFLLSLTLASTRNNIEVTRVTIVNYGDLSIDERKTNFNP